MQLEFKVNHQIITRSDRETIINNSQNYLYLHFTFTDDWSDVIKQAYFKLRDDTTIYKVYLDNDNNAKVPYIICQGKAFSFWLGGTNSDDEVLITTNILKLEFGKSGDVEGAVEDESYIKIVDAITGIESSTLLVSKSQSVYTINVKNLYVVDAEYSNSSLILKGTDGEVIKTVTLPFDEIVNNITSGTTVAGKAKCNEDGEEFDATYARLDNDIFLKKPILKLFILNKKMGLNSL